jgi:hypothetical protein
MAAGAFEVEITSLFTVFLLNGFKSSGMVEGNLSKVENALARVAFKLRERDF